MNQHGQPDIQTLESAKRAILDQLRREWPFPATITPQTLAERVADRVFVQAASELQEDGLLMYEALLIGAGPAPQLLEAALTRRGQLWQDQAS